MWKRGGRSSALDRAQALLSAKRSSGGDVEPARGSAITLPTGAVVGGSAKSAAPNTQPSFVDLSDLSSVSSAPEHGAETPGFAATAAGRTQIREGHPTQDLRPPSSLDGARSRFLKRAPPPATISSQSPVSKHHSSQTAALSRLAQIESRIQSRKQGQEQQAREWPKPAENLTSDMRISPPTAALSPEAPVQLSAQSSSDQNLKGKSFLKNKTPVAVNSSRIAAARSSNGTDIGVSSRSRAAEGRIPSATLEMKSVREVSGVTLESDEEDMRKLLGDSLDSIDNGYLMPGRHSSIRTADKMLSKISQKVQPPPPPAAVPPSSSAPPRSPASPSHRSSPFRFTGQSQAHFIPSVLSPSPSPPCVTPSPPGRLETPHRVGSPQRSLSSMSGHGEVLSLEELFSVGPGSEDPHSEMSAVTSEDFKMNVMTLDDLVPATIGFTEETPGKETEAEHSAPLPGSHHRHRQQSRLKEKEQTEDQQQENAVNYQSDFESESRTEPDYSVSEHLHGDGDEEEVESEVREEASDSDTTHRRHYSSTFSDTSRSCASQRDCSQTFSGRRDSRASASHDSQSFSCESRRRISTRKALKEAAVQTDPLAYTRTAGMATLGPAVGMTYMDPTPGVVHTLSAETVEVLSTFNPAVFALNEMLKQQLAMTRRFVESSRHHHSSLVRSLGPPNYRYTTLEDTKEYIRKNRPPKLTMEEALEEVLQEMRECHHF